VTTLGIFFAGLFAPHLLLAAAYLFLVTGFATYFGLKYPYYRSPLFVVNFSVILAACVSPFLSQNLYRVMAVLIATALAVFLHIFVKSMFYRRELRVDTIKALQELNLASREIFSCFLQPEYAANIYLFEKRLHLRKNKFMHAMHKLQSVMDSSNANTYVAKIDQLFNILMDCSQLRRRVSDYTVFALCDTELSAISLEIDKLFAEMILAVKTQLDVIDSIPLEEKIKLFEDSFVNVLRVTAREPLAFFLFIMSLKAFREAAASF
jgi:hypothetical protein